MRALFERVRATLWASEGFDRLTYAAGLIVFILVMLAIAVVIATHAPP